MWNLVYTVGDNKTVYGYNKPYPILVSEKKKLLATGKFKLGIFNIRKN